MNFMWLIENLPMKSKQMIAVKVLMISISTKTIRDLHVGLCTISPMNYGCITDKLLINS